MSRLPGLFRDLALPVIGAPLFLVSGPRLVIAQCRAGIVGTFPALNARPATQLGEWIGRIEDEIDGVPYGVNLIVHHTNERLEQDLATCFQHRVPLVITSVGEPSAVVEAVHGYGGLVFHDATTVRHARKAADAGADGLILVCAGAGGHAGLLSPFALVDEVRAFYDGPLVLAGAITRGHHIRAAQVLGADMAYMGSRFIATSEADAQGEYKQMLLDSNAADLVYTAAFSGIPANYLRRSVEKAGLSPEDLSGGGPGTGFNHATRGAKAWKDIWSAGQGIGAIHDIPIVAELVARLKAEYEAAK